MKRIDLDYAKRCRDEPAKGHNRWHPDITAAVTADPGEEVVLQTRNAFDGEVTQSSRAGDLSNLNLNVVHPLTGTVFVNGAEPGDLLEVNILQIEPVAWGFTTIIPGFGFLRDVFLEPYIVHWIIEDGYAESPDLPGVRIPGAPFMGTIGVAPSKESCSGRYSCGRTNCCREAAQYWARSPTTPSRPRNPSHPRRFAPFLQESTAATWISNS